MSSKIMWRIVLLVIVSNLLSSVNSEELKPQLTGVLRPILFRSEFVTPADFKEIKRFALKDSLSYTRQGRVVFSKEVTLDRIKLHFTDTPAAQAKNYRTYSRRVLAERVRANPKRYRHLLHKDSFEAYMSGDTRYAPIAPDGDIYIVHHDLNNEYSFIKKSAHGTTDHIGGNIKWGRKATERISNMDRVVLTGKRWAKISALDLAFSNVSLWMAGERNIKEYVVNTSAIVGAGTVAWGVESLCVTSFPLLEGGMPYFFGQHIWLCTGGPASWIATATYLGVQYAIMSGWNEYQLAQKRRIEDMCRTSEREVLRQIIKKRIDANTSMIRNLKES